MKRRVVAVRHSLKILITASLPMQDLNIWVFGGLLSLMAKHAVVEMGKTREQHKKELGQ
jgi:hypothetical protein